MINSCARAAPPGPREDASPRVVVDAGAWALAVHAAEMELDIIKGRRKRFLAHPGLQHLDAIEAGWVARGLDLRFRR